MKIAQPSGYWKCAPFWERLTTRLFLPRPESATQLHLATLLSSPHLSSRYLDTRRDALCWVTQEVDMWLTQLAAPAESVCVCPAQQPSQLWKHSQCWGLDPHLQVRGPTLGRPLHQDAATASMWQASKPQDRRLGNTDYRDGKYQWTVKGWAQERGLTGKGHKGTFWADGKMMS